MCKEQKNNSLFESWNIGKVENTTLIGMEIPNQLYTKVKHLKAISYLGEYMNQKITLIKYTKENKKSVEKRIKKLKSEMENLF